ncbi:MAG: hypothetical protein O2782_21185 [bacterium]|nr:hypothetical protein [bacterium]
MNYLPLPHCLAGLLLVLAAFAGAADAQVAGPVGGPIALATSVTGIVVDGELSDWPQDMPRVPLRNDFSVYGRTDLEGVDLRTSDDFSPAMMIGYDDDKDLLYVAVVVRDDQLFMEGDPIHRDGIEIYLSDLSSGSRPIQHRIATARTGQDVSLGGDRLAVAAWRNEGDHLVFEWQGSVPTSARRSLALDEGGIIGFDVVAIDNDGDGNAAWVPWGQKVSAKSFSNDRVGRLLLAPADMTAADTASLTAIFSAFSDGSVSGTDLLQNLENHEDDFERLIEYLVEGRADVAGPQVAAVVAHMAGRLAAVAAHAGAVASAEARKAEMEEFVPPVPPVPPVNISAEFDDEKASDVAGQALNIA